jgi:hypothetical protein
MRPNTNRSIVLALCAIATACGGDLSSSALSPNSASLTQNRGSQSVPFRGTLEATEHGVVVPPHLLATGSGTGTATHLGQFTVTFDAVANLATSTATAPSASRPRMAISWSQPSWAAPSTSNLESSSSRKCSPS